jgi:hypothetical protein
VDWIGLAQDRDRWRALVNFTLLSRNIFFFLLMFPVLISARG